ncbi:hypothetical protein SBRCBS47491_004954 [Sporothrix bragantina]|uniref:Major facilitator superfamily (MFS) profile domain-containing protein n=1 Tax=Sporothrix bragantina TaxID=671064 RepID=A0ABP0BT41_9PEZI
MLESLANTPLGSFAHWVSGGRLASYPEEHAGFYLPPSPPPSQLQSQPPICTPSSGSEKECSEDTKEADIESGPPSVHVVDWYGDADPANPLHWSGFQKFRIFFTINYANSAIYLSSSVFAASQAAFETAFHTTPMVAGLGISLFVLGYGFGPLFISPLTDMARIGRTPPYLTATFIFLILSIPTATATSVHSFMILRFFQGFFGSPVMTTGGASLSDIASDSIKPLALYTWACSGFAAASIAPIVSSFAVPVLGWRWPLWEVVIVNAPTLLFLLLLPETSPRKILYLRAQRLRKCYPGINYRSKAELEHKTSVQLLLWRSLIVPWQMHALDPSILFTSIYTGFVYGIYYSFFEMFPIVYQGIYGFNLGECGLVYLAIVVGVVLAGIPYCSYVYYYVVPRDLAGQVQTPPEDRLLPAVFASLLVPTGLFIFGWTARSEVHWIVPTIGAGITSAGMVVIIQCVFVYISLGYPQYVASVFAGNGLLRSLIAFAALLWSRPLTDTLGVARGSSLLGGLCVGGVMGLIILYKYGATLRAHSKFAV